MPNLIFIFLPDGILGYLLFDVKLEMGLTEAGWWGKIWGVVDLLRNHQIESKGNRNATH
jgi:hypothetical protein